MIVDDNAMFAMNYYTLADGFEGSYYKDLSARLKRGACATVGIQ